MLWLWLATRNRFRWSVGPLDYYFAFMCARCGVSTPAMVRSMGTGSGSNQMAAMQSAQAAANASGQAAVQAATCPHCNALQPWILGRFDLAAKKAHRNRKLRIPLAIAAALVMLVLVGVPAIGDLHHSRTLIVVATSLATAVGALLFAIFAGAVKTPEPRPTGVWFSRDPSQAPGSWFPAQPGQVPFVPQPDRMLRVISLVTFGIAAVATIVGVALWRDTFRQVYVVSSEGPGNELTVRVDGGSPRKVTQQKSGDDAPNLTVEVRTDASHQIVARGADGRETAYTLDPATAKYGWVLAPHGRQHGLCLASITWYYGTKPKEGSDSLLGKKSDLTALPHAFDNVFTQPPATVQTQNGSSETRTSLRALDCAALERDQIVPFKDRQAR